MIIVLRKTATQEQTGDILERLRAINLTGQVIRSSARTIISILEGTQGLPSHIFSQMQGVEKLIRLESSAFKATAAEASVNISNRTVIGSGIPKVIAGPCSVEGQAQILHIARQVGKLGASGLRGGAFKPRTSPYDFQGLGLEGLKYLREAADATELPVISEVMAPEQVESAEEYLDVLQIGARNMYNYALLKEVGKSRRPVLLKRALSATIDELLNSAEYIMSAGNQQVILCERGIRTFEKYTRNTLDLSAVAALKNMTRLPVMVDPSHGTGRPELVRPMCRAAVACGADGLLIEVHDNPAQAYSDGEQAITPDMLKDIIADVHLIYDALTGTVERSLSSTTI